METCDAGLHQFQAHTNFHIAEQNRNWSRARAATSPVPPQRLSRTPSSDRTGAGPQSTGRVDHSNHFFIIVFFACAHPNLEVGAIFSALTNSIRQRSIERPDGNDDSSYIQANPSRSNRKMLMHTTSLELHMFN